MGHREMTPDITHRLTCIGACNITCNNFQQVAIMCQQNTSSELQEILIVDRSRQWHAVDSMHNMIV
jgi:hypothetical protein